MKKILAILLAMLMVLSLFACGDAEKAPDAATAPDKADNKAADAGTTAEDSDTLTIAATSDAGTLSPCLCKGDTFALVCTIMEPLWDVSMDTGEVQFLLCESVDVVSDTEQILHLRKGVKFHNGNPFTASDVIFSMQLHRDSGASGAPRVQTVDLEKTNVIDDNTLDLHLLAPTIANWTVLSQCIIYDEESYDEANAQLNPIGTGAYKFVSYVPNSEIKCERNDDYWGEKADYKYLNCRILAEDSQRVNALETGLVDIGNVSTEDYEYVSGLDSLNAIGYYSGNYLLLDFNFGHNSALYGNTDGRRAIIHAINWEAILNTVYHGLGKMMKSCTVEYCFDYADDFDYCSETYSKGYDVELAKQLADSSGLTGQTIQLVTNGTASYIRCAEMIQAMLSEIGVTVEIKNYDPATAWQLAYDVESDWEIQLGDGITPNRRCGDLLLNGVRYSEARCMEGAFENNAEYLELAPLCMSLQDEGELHDLLLKMMKWYNDEVLNYSAFDIEHFIGVSKTIDESSIHRSIGSSSIRYGEVKKAS